MGRHCTVCDHPARGEIDRRLAESKSLRNVSQDFGGVSEAALLRHKRNHMRPKLMRALARRADRDADSLVAAVLDSIEQTRAILAGASDPDLKLRAIDRLHRGLELRGKTTGEIAPPSLTLMLGKFRVGTEDELSRIVAQHRELEGLTPEGMRADLIAVARLYLSEHPEDAGRLRAEMFGEVQIEEADYVALAENAGEMPDVR
jgi:hypothetical protein